MRFSPYLLVAACFTLSLSTTTRAEEPTAKWVSLFDGKSLAGWTPKIKGYDFGEDPNQTFRVADGAIQVNYDKYKDFGGQFGHLFYKDKFSHYRLKIEYRFIKDQCPGGPGWATRNSGVMLHCQDPKTMRKDQDFPVSIEAQFLGGLGKGKRTTCSVCTPGTNIVMKNKLTTQHCIVSTSKTYDGDQWVTVEIEVNGSGVVKHIIDGESVMEYEQPQLDERDADGKKLIVDGKKLISEGYISLQAESHPCEFRKVEIMILKK
ncbi:MAG: DUF1080 domain-containing protein [Zavarzinella sp.]